MTKNFSADFSRRKSWEGEAPAKPKRQRMAIGNWRMVNSERQAANGE